MYLLDSKDNDQNPSNVKGEGEKNIDYARRMELYMKAYENNTGLVKCDGTDVSLFFSFINSQHSLFSFCKRGFYYL